MIRINELRIDRARREIVFEAEVEANDERVVIDSVVVDTQDTFIEDGPSSEPVYVRSFHGDDRREKVRLYISERELGGFDGRLFFVYVIAAPLGILSKREKYFDTWKVNGCNFSGYVCKDNIHFSEIKKQGEYLLGRADSNCVVKVSGLKDGQTLCYGSLDDDGDDDTVNILSNGIYPIKTDGVFRGFYAGFEGECDIDIKVLAESFEEYRTETVEDSCTGIKRVCLVADLRLLYRKAMSYVRDLDRPCTNHRMFADWILKMEAFDLAVKTGNNSLAIEYWRQFLRGMGLVEDEDDTDVNCGCNG